MGKRGNAVNQHFLLFSTMFSTQFQGNFHQMGQQWAIGLMSTNALNLYKSKFLSCGKD